MNDSQQAYEKRRCDRFVVSTDPALQDVNFIHGFLTQSYWAAGIPRKVVARSLQHSLCFGLFDGPRQIGLARVITDRATFAYLCDVFVDEKYQGHGLGIWLVDCVLAHPELQGLRRFMLATRDAHGLYSRFGFAAPQKPQNLMEKSWPNVYDKTAQTNAPPAKSGRG